MRVILKYRIGESIEKVHIDRFLCVKDIEGDAYVWALVDEENPDKHTYRTLLTCTGWENKDENICTEHYIGSFQDAFDIWHVFWEVQE